MNSKQKMDHPAGLFSNFKDLFVYAEEIRDIKYWREKILNSIFSIFSIFGIFAYVPSVYMAAVSGYWAVVLIDTIAYGSILLVCFSKNLSFIFKTLFILTCLYLIGISMLFLIDADYSLMWFFSVPIMAAILLGLKAAVIALLINALTFIVAAYFVKSGLINWSNVEENLLNGWIILSVNFMFLNSIMSIAISIVVEQLKNTLEKVILANALLDDEHKNLVAEVRQRIKAEEEKDVLNKKLQRSQRMEAIGMMAGGVAHDLNNMLSAIINYPEIILMKLPENSEHRKPLNAVIKSGNRAAEIVSDLLTVARGVASSKNVYSLNNIAAEYMDSPELTELKLHYPDIVISSSFDDDIQNILCSHVHVFKSLMNLVSNSAESIDGKGTILIRTYSAIMSVDPELDEDRKKLSVLEVCDSGKGISQKDIEHIFEPFYTRKVMGKSGTGLGLAIVWNTAHDHGGTVTVKSDLSGSCFCMCFPVTEDCFQSEQEESLLEDMKGNGEVVLVVDDEEMLRDVASDMLATLGYKVFVVDSGEAAVEYLKKNAVDIVVLDMLMPPGMNGLETYQQIIQFNLQQKAIIASGFAENADVKEARKLGVSEFISKPYSRVQIGLAVRNTLGIL